jgi:cyclase
LRLPLLSSLGNPIQSTTIEETQIPCGNDKQKNKGESTVLTKRIIACLDVRDGRVVKGVQFLDIIDAGDPAELAHRHAALGADEIVLLDITATHEGRGTLLDTVKRTAEKLFVPFTVGGGIRSAEDAAAVFNAGADKVSINSSAIARPELIGEILLTSMNTDGMRQGFDCELTRRVSEAVQIPVIASGGAGSAAHFAEVFLAGKADAALAASIFHFGVTDSRELKAEVARAGVPMRLPC